MSLSDDVRFFCGNRRCGALITVEFGYADKYVACNTCGEEVRVPKTARRRKVDFPPAVHSPKRVRANTEASPEPVIEYASGPTRFERFAIWVRQPAELTAGRGLARALAAIPTGLWFLSGSVVVLGALMVRAQPDLPANYEEIIDEIASVTEIYQVPQSDSTGSRLVWMQSADNALALQLANFDGAETNQIDEFPENPHHSTSAYHKLFGWAPDDRHFAYSRHSKRESAEADLVIANGRSGDARSVYTHPTFLHHLVWLTAGTVAFLDSSNRLHTAQLESEGLRLTGSRLLGHDDEIGAERLPNRRRKAGATPFVRVGEQSIAYVKDDNLHRLDLNTGKSTQISSFNETLDFEWLDYSEASGQFLFCHREQQKPFQRRAYVYHPDGTNSESLKPLALDRGGAIKACWINGGKGVATLVNAGPKGHLSVINDLAYPQIEQRRFEEGTIRAFAASPNGHNLFVVGATGPEPHAVWRCEPAARTLAMVVPTVVVPFKAARIVPPQPMTIKDDTGKVVSFYLIPPINLERGKKYPLVIDGPNQGRWTHHGQFFANIGCYYAAVNRHGLFSSDNLNDAAADIITVNEQLTKQSQINPHRVFLVGFSAATRVIAELAVTHPEKWAGIMFNNPVQLPSAPANVGGLPRLFISMGDSEETLPYIQRSVLKLETEPVTILQKYHSRAGHTFRGERLQAERLELVAAFIKI